MKLICEDGYIAINLGITNLSKRQDYFEYTTQSVEKNTHTFIKLNNNLY